MSILSSIAAFGVFVSLPFAGALLAKRIPLPQVSTAARLILYSIIGIAAWSVPLATGAAVRFFYPAVFGAIGWGIVAVGLVKNATALRQVSVWAALKSPEGFAIAAMVLVAFAYNLKPGESVIGGRDMGVYTTHAIYIANHHRLDVEYPWMVTGDTAFSSVAETFPGYYPTQPTITVQFAKLYPVWLAQAYGAAGFAGLIRLNILFAVLGLLAFYLCCRMVLEPQYAFFALMVAALNAGQIWVTHVTLSEILTQMLVWGFLFLFCKALTDEHRPAARWAGLLFGLTITVRVDSYLLVGLVFFAHAAYLLLSRERARTGSSVWAAFYQTGFVVFLLGGLYDLATTRPYIIDLLPQIGLLNYFTIAAAVVLILVMIIPRLDISWLLRPSASVGLGAVLLLLVVYGYAVRPHWSPFVFSKMPNGEVIRDHREDTLVNLASYITVLFLFAAPLGITAIISHMKESRNRALAVPAVLWLGFAALYCYNPSIAPDHFWAIRRFLPLILPGFVWFGTFGIQQLFARFNGVVRPALFTIAAAGVAVYFVFVDQPALETRENDGFYEQLASFAAMLPSDRIILSDDGGQWARWETPLAFAFDKKIVPLDLDDSLTMSVVLRWVAARPAQSEPVVLLRESRTSMSGLRLVGPGPICLRRTLIESTVHPVPDSVIYDENIVGIYQLSDLPADYKNVAIGGEQYWGVREAGFYDEPPSDAHARWSNGRASLSIPVDALRPPRAMKVQIASTGPKGTALTILANRRPVFQGTLPAGPWSKIFSLDGISPRNILTVNLFNEPFVPARVLPSSGDQRALGVYLRGITLLDSAVEVPAAPLPISGYRSSITVVGAPIAPVSAGQPVQLTITAINRGSSIWQSINDVGAPFGSVRIGIQWTAKATGKVMLEQRAELPHAILPGAFGQVAYTLRASLPDGTHLPAGAYDLRFGLVQEGIAWFHNHGDKDYEFSMLVR